MVTRRNCLPRQSAGALSAELAVAMAILAAVMIPLSFAFQQEMKLCRAHYHDAVVMEIVDGEMEILAAGEWRAFKEGSQPYPVRAEATKNLPPGQFVLTVSGKKLRLEWRPARPRDGRKMTREAVVK